MRILFHHRIASRDGQAVHIDELIEALNGLGHEVVLVGPGRTARTSFGADAGLVVAALKRTAPHALYELLELGYNGVAAWRLWRQIRQHRPDAIYERYSLAMLAGVWLSRLTGVPLLLEVNSPLAEERAAHGGLSLRRLLAWTERACWRGADMVLPVTEVLAGHLRAAGVPEERILVVPNGINPRRFAGIATGAPAKAQLGLGDRLVLGFTGFVRPWHSLDRAVDLLAALGREHALHLLIVGDGPARASLERRARALGVADRLTVTGVVGRDEVAAHVAAFDVALQPGVTPYASPLKLVEYMALGRAIVAPDTENIREVLTDGADALLFDPADPEGFARAIERLCRDPGLRDRLGAAARAAVAEKGLTWENNARRVAALTEHLATAKRQRDLGPLAGDRAGERRPEPKAQ